MCGGTIIARITSYPILILVVIAKARVWYRWLDRPPPSVVLVVRAFLTGWPVSRPLGNFCPLLTLTKNRPVAHPPASHMGKFFSIDYRHDGCFQAPLGAQRYGQPSSQHFPIVPLNLQAVIGKQSKVCPIVRYFTKSVSALQSTSSQAVEILALRRPSQAVLSWTALRLLLESCGTVGRSVFCSAHP